MNIKALLDREDVVSVVFGKSILDGNLRVATLIIKGKGDWIKGKGPTPEAAFEDMMRKVDGGGYRPVPEMKVRMPL